MIFLVFTSNIVSFIILSFYYLLSISSTPLLVNLSLSRHLSKFKSNFHWELKRCHLSVNITLWSSNVTARNSNRAWGLSTSKDGRGARRRTGMRNLLTEFHLVDPQGSPGGVLGDSCTTAPRSTAHLVCDV